MKVSILTPSASRNAGGLFNSVRRGAIEMREDGLDLQVLAPTDEHSNEDLRHWSPINPSLYRPLGSPKLGIALGLRDRIAGFDPEIVHLHGLWTFQSWVVPRLRKPVVVSPRGMLDPWALRNSSAKKKIALRFFEERNLQSTTCFHALNMQEAQAIRSFGLRTPIAIIPNGIDPPIEASVAPPSWLNCSHRKVMLFLGRIHPKKGLNELLKAWSLLKVQAPQTVNDWILIVAGWDDGGHLPALRKLTEELGLLSDVLFPGPIFNEEKHSLLSNSDAFILPSYSEGLPMSVLEAWGYGLPVFMTDHCNLSFAFPEGGAIRITTTPRDIANTLSQWLISSKLPEFAAKGPVIAKRDFGWRMIARQHLELYNWLAGATAKPDFVV